jgi:hypothetical protein
MNKTYKIELHPLKSLCQFGLIHPKFVECPIAHKTPGLDGSVTFAIGYDLIRFHPQQSSNPFDDRLKVVPFRLKIVSSLKPLTGLLEHSRYKITVS